MGKWKKWKTRNRCTQQGVNVIMEGVLWNDGFLIPRVNVRCVPSVHSQDVISWFLGLDDIERMCDVQFLAALFRAAKKNSLLERKSLFKIRDAVLWKWNFLFSGTQRENRTPVWNAQASYGKGLPGSNGLPTYMELRDLLGWKNGLNVKMVFLFVAALIDHGISFLLDSSRSGVDTKGLGLYPKWLKTGMLIKWVVTRYWRYKKMERTGGEATWSSRSSQGIST